MIRILFVCHGNICRSPMAEFVMRRLVNESGMGDKVYIESAATSREELGNPIYPPAKRVLNANGISCDEKTSRQMTQKDYEKFDYIIAMDKNNIRNMKSFVGDDSLDKVSMLMDYTDTPRDVADPWYTGNFDATWDDVNRGCAGLLKTIQKEDKKNERNTKE